MIRMMLLVTITFVATLNAEATTYYVRKTGNDSSSGQSAATAFQTIQQAASQVRHGDRVYVGAGTYDESVYMNVTTNSGGASTGSGWTLFYADTTGSITGDAGDVIVRSSENSWAMQATGAHHLLIYGFTFAENPAYAGTCYGCITTNSQGYTYFYQCKFVDQVYAIRTYGDEGVYVANCDIEGGRYGVYNHDSTLVYVYASEFKGIESYCIYSRDTDNSYASSCQFSNIHPETNLTTNYYGIYGSGTSLEITECDFDSPYYGIRGSALVEAQILACTFSDSLQYGIYCDGENLALSDSTFTNGKTGCMLGDTSGAKPTITDCSFTTMNVGVQAYQSDIEFRDVLFDENTYGIYSRSLNPTLTLDASDTIEFTNNKYAIYSAHYSTEDVTLSIEAQDFRGNQTGIFGSYTSAKISNCEFAGDTHGVYLTNSKSADIRNCVFEGKDVAPTSTTYGIYAYGDAITLRDNDVEKYTYGIYAYNKTDNALTLKDLTIDNIYSYGVYVRGGTWDWVAADNIKVSNAKYGVCAREVDWTIDGIVSDGTCEYAFMDYYGNCKIQNSKAHGTRYGFYAYRSESLSAFNVEASGNASYGISVYDCPVLQFEKINAQNNVYCGLYVNNPNENSFKLTDSVFNNNTNHGLYTRGVDLNPTTLTNVSFSGNKHALRSYDKTLRLTPEMNVKFSENLYSAMSYNARIELDGVEIEDRIPVYLLNGSLSIKDATLTGGIHGVLAYINGTAEISDSRFEGGNYGVYLQSYADDMHASVTDCEISNAGVMGIYCRMNRGTNPKFSISSCKLDNCRYGIYALRASVDISNVRITNSSVRAVHSNDSSTTLVDSEIDTTGSWAIYATGPSLDVARTTVANGKYGIAMLTSKGTVTNTVVRNSDYGIYANLSGGDYQILHSTIANISRYGLWHEDGNTLIRNSIVDADYYALWNRNQRGTFTHDHNLVFSARTAYVNTTQGEGEINKSPVFVNAASGDVRLGAGSPAINAGMDMSSTLTSDISGNARPSYRGFEMGAHEYMSPSGSLRVVKWDEVAR